MAVQQRTIGGLSLILGTALTAALLVPTPAPARAEAAVCSGTRLQLAIQEQGNSPVDRFRFSLAVSGEGVDEETALKQLNTRLDRLRRELNPLVLGRLVVPAPHTHRRGRSSEQRFMANTGVSGEVSRVNYNRLIQAVGAMPGVRQQGMRSVADPEADLRLQQRLLAAALKRGEAEARATARVIGASQVTLQSIRRDSDLSRPRPMRMEARSQGFDPEEAPEPQTTLRLNLDYCLS